MESKYLHYLNDSLNQLISEAKSIKNESEFNNGVRFGLYTAISQLLTQANAFNILAELDEKIKGFDLESLI